MKALKINAILSDGNISMVLDTNGTKIVLKEDSFNFTENDFMKKTDEEDGEYYSGVLSAEKLEEIMKLNSSVTYKKGIVVEDFDDILNLF